MPKITKRGTHPDEVKHEATCFWCGTEFTFKRKEATVEQDSINSSALFIPCPLCGVSVSTPL